MTVILPVCRGHARKKTHDTTKQGPDYSLKIRLRDKRKGAKTRRRKEEKPLRLCVENANQRYSRLPVGYDKGVSGD
jgi:hypothetical protein